MRPDQSQHRFSHRPSPALGVALLALFLALGGTGYAATQSQSASAQGASTKSPPKRGPAGPRGPRGAAGSALAYAHVVDGALDEANSKNVTVTKASNVVGVCLKVTTAQAPRNVVAMIDNGGANPATTRIAGTTGAAVARVCPAGSDAEIATVEEAKGFTLKPFYVTFN